MIALAEDGEFITVRHLSPEVACSAEPSTRGPDLLSIVPGGNLKKKVEALEARLVCDTLDWCHWNHSRAARELGLSRVGLSNKIRRYKIQRAGDETGER